jgi:hypothetical protein
LSSFARGRKCFSVASQNLAWLWSAATRPATENGPGFTVEQATRELEQIRRLWVLLPELPFIDEWERLVKSHRVAGKNTQVAAMHVIVRTLLRVKNSAEPRCLRSGTSRAPNK